MWQLDYPWLLLLLPLPLLGYRWLPAYREARSAIRVPFFAAISRAIGGKPERDGLRGSRSQLLLNLLVWGLVLMACARPVWIEKPIEKRQPVRDILLAIDISQSMETRDFTSAAGERSDRLNAVKGVVHDFIRRRKDDRLGLVVFGSNAFPQAPLTLDHGSLGLLLDEVGIGMAGPNTAIGDAIGLSVKLLDQAREKDKLVILLTDGNDTGSVIPPQQAAELAHRHGVTIHTIGIGDVQAEGEAKVDLDSLRQIAGTTGGEFFRAEDRQELEQVYARLDAMTAHEVQTLAHQPRRELFWLPLGAALGLLALYHLGALGVARLRMRRTAEA
ncbi:vWA domain-containing protein [Pseudomonas jinjuensis]|uniref:Ca-activated chloride channel family protein n=1 Tax=Pseudomonas jinjuensis TaxID=198616 RepID=A0A1H0BFH9_9PSED|nr:VWA domain-containing protein [Pseudomonas jinjuensis]SDN44429.1 Ca-activated chloride channel family protein [Pseudomonas jinjuensis]